MKHRLWQAAAALMLVCVFPLMAAAQSPLDKYLVRNGHALLVGVSNYRDIGWNTLDTVPREISELEAGLRPHFESVQTLINPTSAAIRSALLSLIQQSRSPDERMFIFYAGHGVTDANFQGYITGIDTPARANTSPIPDAVSMAEVDAVFRGGAARQGLAVFDSCFSGSIFATRSLPSPPATGGPGEVFDLIRRPVRTYISAGRANEVVPADSPVGRLFLQGLQGGADVHHNGYITGTDLGYYLQGTVPGRTNNRLRPQYGSIDQARNDGEFVFKDMSGQPTAGAPTRGVFIIFFDFEKTTITPEALVIAQQAADFWKAKGGSRVQVTGYTDRGHTYEEAEAISRGTAENVAKALSALGVSPTAQDVNWQGDRFNRVLTAPGVREPQNRRVEIVIQ